MSNTHKYDYLIVGAGLAGSMFAYKACQNGKKCLVIDKRKHVGGNLYCENIGGIPVHKYGAHIFHTNNKDVWDFVNSLAKFNSFVNSPIANYKGEIYNLPFNMNTFHQMWGVVTPQEAGKKLRQERLRLECREPINLEEQALCLVGKDIYNKLIKEYTEKQWGKSCKELPPSIIKRLPVRFTYDNNYFNDKYQGIPIGGYNQIFDVLLKDSVVLTCVDFFNSKYKEWQKYAEKIVYTGKIDEFFGYCFGELDWRSLSFETTISHTQNFQGNAVVNYTSKEVPYTRIIEHKHFEFFGDDIYKLPFTVITKEYPVQYRKDVDAYYPINNMDNNILYLKYKELADKQDNAIFLGRLAEYKYYDMAPIIEKILCMDV